MNTPVNFELAKLLKEKGFNLKCEYIRDLYNSELPLKASKAEDWNFDKPLLDAYSAPTIAEIVMWLYERHKVWIEVFMYYDATFGYLISEVTNEGIADTPTKRGFTSPTEAYERGIGYTLQNRI